MPKAATGPRLALNRFGIYEIRWTEGRRSHELSTRTGDLQEAQRALAGFLMEMQAERARAKRVTVGGIIDYYAEHRLPGLAAEERQRFAFAALRPHFGDLQPTDISPDVVSAYCAKRRAGAYSKRRVTSNGTLRRELNALIAAINFAADRRLVDRNDVPKIDLPASPPPRDFWLTEAELAGLLGQAERAGQRVHLFLLIAAHTAARKRSIETLAWTQVDFMAGMIHFNPPGRAQTKKRRVPVPMSDDLAAALRAAQGVAKTEWVLGTSQPIRSALRVFLPRAAAALSNPRILEVTPHVLRHTWATHAARAGVPMWEIAGVLGDTLSTVERVYAHHSPDHLRRAVNFRRVA